MRQVMQEILPRLWLGPLSSSRKLTQLRAHGITHVLVVRSEVEQNNITARYPDEFQYHILTLPDLPTASLLPHLPEVMSFLDNARLAGGALIHCCTGISRSAAVTIAYVMRDQGMTYDDAFQHVSLKRCCVHPNLGFVHQLTEYEFIAGTLGQTPQRLDGKKRGFDDIRADMEEDGSLGEGGTNAMEM
eukprot:TRINITY_DN60266_c0_g1_i1.p1 TRINITY_DN60266_c0_g1~~TRINITY_DN60266_c0_g1_i1.p1  ORF type:complete len:219 (-),score=28.30 TRINITY_DN60266_c0_g1_i1:209-772(-)